MRTKDILSTSIKVLGIYFLINSLSLVAYAVNSVWAFKQDIAELGSLAAYTTLGANISYFIVMFAISIAMIIRSESIGKRLMPKNSQGEAVAEERITKETILQIVFVGIGVFLVSTALPGIVGAIGSLPVKTGETNLLVVLDIASGTLKLIFGIVLFFGSKGLVRLVKFFKEA